MYTRQQFARIRALQAGYISPCSPNWGKRWASRVPEADTILKALRSPKPKPYVRRELPESPFTRPKPPTKTFKVLDPKPSIFVVQIEKNAYAHALSSPIRMCAVTSTRLPLYFLQDFELAAHPQTKEIWYLPRSIAKPLVDNATPKSQEESSELQPLGRPSHDPTIGPKTYTLAQYNLIANMFFKKGPFRGNWQSWGAHRKRARGIDSSKIKMRPDTHDYVLRLLRDRAVESLLWCDGKGHSGTAYLARVDAGEKSWQQIEAIMGMKKQIGAFLWLGEDVSSKVMEKPATAGEAEVPTEKNDQLSPAVDENLEQSLFTRDGNTGADLSTKDIQPGDFATVNMLEGRKSAKVPIHDLRRLLGAGNVALLRQKAPQKFGGCQVVSLKQRKSTMLLQLRLWKLQGYLATHAKV